jgi:hypothetical protein
MPLAALGCTERQERNAEKQRKHTLRISKGLKSVFQTSILVIKQSQALGCRS